MVNQTTDQAQPAVKNTCTLLVRVGLRSLNSFAINLSSSLASYQWRGQEKDSCYFEVHCIWSDKTGVWGSLL